MPSIDERVVAMSFENQVFETRVAQTMATLNKLDAAVRNVGATSGGFDKLEAQANRVTFQQPMSALDKLKAKFSTIGSGATQGFTEVENAASRISLTSPFRAIDNLINKFGRLSAGTTFTDIERAADRTTLSGLNTALDNVTAKFSVLQGAASVALGNIASQAISRGTAFAKSFAIGPVMDGLHEYETNLKSIQTIQANTDRPLTEINSSLEELNRYSDQTIYNFSEMARNIGTFTAAGVELQTATSSIKGIANLAALSGSSSQQAATAMYQLSQAISAGRVSLQDWNSVVNAGMGGKKLQNALAQTAIAMGDIDKSAVKLEGPMKKLTINGKSFRESIMAGTGDKPWLSSEILVNTLAALDGRFSRAALAAEKTKDGLKKYTAAQVEAKIADNRAAIEKKNGVKYSDEQFKALMKLSDSAFKSATEVKTLGQVFQVARETIGSGWAASFQSIFGNLTEAKKTFTELSGAINGFIESNALARNAVLHDWKAMGGRTALIDGIRNAFVAILAILKPIGAAFRQIFPRQTAEQLVAMTRNFRDLMAQLKIGSGTAESLRRIFAGVFAVFHIGWTVIKNVAGAIFDLLGIVGRGSGGVLNFVASIGDFLVALDKAISQGGLLKGVLNGMVAGLGGVIELFKALGRAVAGIFTGANNASGLSSAMNSVTEAGGPLAAVAEKIVAAWRTVVRIFDRVKTVLDPAFEAIGSQASKLASALGEAFSTGNFDQTMSVLQTGLLGGILLILRRFRSSLDIALSGGIFDKITDTLGAVTDNLKAMQQNLQARTLFAIAASLGVLAAAIYVLSTINGEDLARALTGMAVGMGQLVGVMSLLGRAMSGPGRLGFLMMPFVAASMIGLAVAATILGAAMKIFASMSWEDLVKGLAGVGGALVAVGTGMRLLGPMTLIQGPALIALAIGLNIMAAALKQFADLSWEEMAQGLAGLALSLAALNSGLILMGPSLILTGPGLVAVSIAMNMLAGAVAAFGAMKFEDIVEGIGAVAASLISLGIGLLAIPPTVGLTGAGLIVVAAGMTALSAAIAILGNMNVSTLVKGIVGMGAALVVLGTGLIFMSGTLGGSAALLAAAVAMTLLGPALGLLGTLKWSTIVSGLGAMAATLGVLAVVGTLVAGPIVTLSVALGALGLALTVLTAPIYIFAQALALLGSSGTKGIGVMVAALTAFVALIPKIVIDFIKGIVGIVESLAEIAPKVAVAIGKIIDTLLGIVIGAAPKLAIALGTLIGSFLVVIDQNAPRIIASGVKLLTSFLSGIANNIDLIMALTGTIVTKFINGLTTQIPKITASGIRLLTSWLTGIASGAARIVAAGVNVVVRFLTGVAAQAPRLVGAGVLMITRFINAVAGRIGSVVASGVNLVVAFLRGIGRGLPRIVQTAVDVIVRFVRAIGRETPRLADAGFKALIQFLHGIANAIRNNEGDLIAAGVDIATAIVEGLVDGLGKTGHLVKGALMQVVNVLPKFAKKILGIKSPSTVFREIGENTMQGFANGIVAQSSNVSLTMGRALKMMVRENRSARELGAFLGKDFIAGLSGAVDPRSEATKRIDSTMTSLRTKLREQTNKIREQVKADRDKLKQELEQDNPSAIAVQTVATDIRNNTILLRSAQRATANLMNNLRDEKRQLTSLAESYDTVTAQLEKAKQALDEATRARDDSIANLRNQYNTLPDIGSLMDEALAEAALTATERADRDRKAREDEEKRRRIDQVANYKAAIAAQIRATQEYMATLEKLRALGLDDATYNKLLGEGTKNQEFASQLLQGGKSAVDQINKLDAQLLATSTKLAQDASANLYQAGVNAAQGLVDGLKSRQTSIQNQMDSIAAAMVRSIKRQLGIRSPSRVMAEVGKFTAQGVIRGLQMSQQSVANAAADVGDEAASAMTGSLSHISDLMSNEIDTDLTITPVLDLSRVRRDAATLGSLTSDASIIAGTSFGQASAASQEVSASQEAAAAAAVAASPTFQFEQNNYSPESLSDVEIYRQTKNQLGQIKSALGLAS